MISVDALFRGQEVLDKKRTQIRDFSTMIIGGIKGAPMGKFRGRQLYLPAGVKGARWYCGITWIGGSGITVDSMEITYITGSGKEVAVVRLDKPFQPQLQDVAEVHAALPELLKGLCNEFPQLEGKLMFLVDAN